MSVHLAYSVSHQFSGSVLFLHFLLQLSEALLHALMERSEVIRHPLAMQSDSSAQQGDLQEFASHHFSNGASFLKSYELG